ncbi:hypothetical protein SUGI_1486210 [Cryptomeria japonica]|uniref:Uncharacterized protein n=1 Tax=Cryptomeria japonica TaxID=3369 RepID=A0AAD3RRR7_CRYJA|nr:hypothetical protein SUGI_1486210 [Cryptomeria japonica]
MEGKGWWVVGALSICQGKESWAPDHEQREGVESRGYGSLARSRRSAETGTESRPSGSAKPAALVYDVVTGSAACFVAFFATYGRGWEQFRFFPLYLCFLLSCSEKFGIGGAASGSVTKLLLPFYLLLLLLLALTQMLA